MRLVLALLVVLSGCGLYEDGYPDDTDTVIETLTCPGEPAQAQSVTYSGMTLTVAATYGGCEATRIWACWDGDVGNAGAMEPFMASISIHHEPAGNCDALFTSELSFSIEPIVDDWLGYVRLFIGGVTIDWQRNPE